MKTKYIYTHDTDPEKEKVTVKKTKRSINDTTYKATTKIDGNKYVDVIVHDDGNGLSIYMDNKTIRVEYHELVQLFSILECAMRDQGYCNLKLR